MRDLALTKIIEKKYSKLNNYMFDDYTGKKEMTNRLNASRIFGEQDCSFKATREAYENPLHQYVK